MKLCFCILSILHLYLSSSSSGDPLQWWRQNAGQFQTLAPLARRFLTPPPSSVPSERVFSTVGAIYQDRRSSLTGSKAEMLCFLYYNLPLLNWQY
ncbi:Zinc finger BED domain-containing protein 4 [Anabarilius grahami]|uniref:Zinc finger BED domain-containing protein 4 n=1 Tax=Anabarilius grahami TaxID=495550 RepID=A0A3N0YJJ8_ANAGA|nr:Zinc finger BED domain-containing protein 4 [Anabarilius grahami]